MLNKLETYFKETRDFVVSPLPVKNNTVLGILQEVVTRIGRAITLVFVGIALAFAKTYAYFWGEKKALPLKALPLTDELVVASFNALQKALLDINDEVQGPQSTKVFIKCEIGSIKLCNVFVMRNSKMKTDFEDDHDANMEVATRFKTIITQALEPLNFKAHPERNLSCYIFVRHENDRYSSIFWKNDPESSACGASSHGSRETTDNRYSLGRKLSYSFEAKLRRAWGETICGTAQAEKTPKQLTKDLEFRLIDQPKE